MLHFLYECLVFSASCFVALLLFENEESSDALMLGVPLSI